MKLKSKFLGFEAGGKPIVIINKEDASEIGIRSLGRVQLKFEKKEMIAIVNISTRFISRNFIGISEEVGEKLKLKENDEVEVEIAPFPMSLNSIINKLKGRRMTYDEILQIVKDVVGGNLSDIEIAAFVTALNTYSLDLEEAAHLAIAMYETGEKLKLNKKTVFDKHCLPADIPTIVRNDGNIKVENIGMIIDNIFESCKPNEIRIENNTEFTKSNLRNLHALTFDENGKMRFVPVSGVYRLNSPDFLEEIELIGKRKLRCTADHTIFVLKDSKIINVPAKKIKVGDYVLVPSGFSNDKIIKEISFEKFKRTNRRYKELPKKLKITKELMRLLGYYIAEGFTNYQGVFLNFGSHEKDLIEDSIKCVKETFDFSPTLNYPHLTAIRVSLYSQILSKIFKEVIKAGNNASNKRIPGFVFDVPDEMKIEFLRALFRGDGYQRRGYESIYVTVSKKLATDLQYFLSLMGISATFSERKESERDFPLTNGKKGTYKSKTQKVYVIYTQAREIFGGRQKANVAFTNLLPIKELGYIETSEIGWEFRRELKRNNYITKQKLLKIIDKVKSEDVKKLATGSLSVLRVKTHKMVKSDSKYIYDFKVDGYNRFIAGTGPICIHNSVGGVPGDKTTLLVVPIVAAAGLTIPKTSSRAITSAAGTADRAESLMKVDLEIDEMRTVVEMTSGCFVWGGSLKLAPADDIFIQVEFPLGIDPLLLSSIMAKKKAVGANYLVIDIPTGRGTKIKTIGEANLLAKDFLVMGKKLGIETKCAITYGEQPIGHTLGPALEAREAMEVITRKKNVPDLIDKAVNIAGMILEMGGRKDGKETALEILKSGKAEQKIREIIGHQQGDPEVKPEDIHIGDYGFDYHAEKSGTVLWVNNQSLVEIAKMAGSPKDRGAGVYIYKKLGEQVKKGEKLFTVYAEKNIKLARTRKVIDEDDVIGIGDRMEMLIKKIEEAKTPKKPYTIIER